MFSTAGYGSYTYASAMVPVQVELSGMQSVFDTGQVAISAGQALFVSGVQAQFDTGQVQASGRARVGVSGVQARFYMGNPVLWSDVLVGDGSVWVDIFQNNLRVDMAGIYGGAPIATVTYSGQLAETLGFEQDEWEDVHTTGTDSWTDIIT